MALPEQQRAWRLEKSSGSVGLRYRVRQHARGSCGHADDLGRLDGRQERRLGYWNGIGAKGGHSIDFDLARLRRLKQKARDGIDFIHGLDKAVVDGTVEIESQYRIEIGVCPI